MDRAGVAGPVFISVAPRETAAEKMNKFLDINPMVPRERLFVDDSPTFAAYASAGFKNIGEDQKTSLADATKLTAPRLSAGAWWRYLTNVASLSPVPDGLKFGEVPEGVLRCVLNRRVDLHAIDATPARWRGDAGSSPLDRARTAASSPRNDLVKNCRVHPTHWMISTQVFAPQRIRISQLLVVRFFECGLAFIFVHLEFYIWIIRFKLLEAELDGCCIFIKLCAARRQRVRVVQDV